MAKSLEETLKDLRAGGYSEGGIRSWLVNKGFPSAKVDKAMALRTAKDSVSSDLRAKRDKIREARIILYNAANHEDMRHRNPTKYAELERALEKLIDDYARSYPDYHDSSARDFHAVDSRHARLHRALDYALDRVAVGRDAGVVWEVVVGNIGNVYCGPSEVQAKAKFTVYENQSRSLVGRAGGEDVTLLRNNEIVREHVGDTT